MASNDSESRSERMLSPLEYCRLGLGRGGRSYMWEGHSLVCNKDLKPTNDLCERDRTVGFPVLYRLRVINEDDEVICFSGVVDLALGSVSTSHLD